MTLQEAADYTLNLCDRIGALTDVPGETTRLFCSPATREVHALLREEMERLGMRVWVDAAANLRGVYAGDGSGAGTLLVGSHIDTVPNAGRYDGILGVATGLGMLRLLGGRRLPYAIELIAFSEEEGVRFRMPFIGSRALVGTLGDADYGRADAAGVTVAEALRAFGVEPQVQHSATLTPGTFGFLEVHIEQGPVLERLGVPLGVVGTIVGQTRYEVTFTGQANHAGTTPMALRRDALTGAAEWILEVEKAARRNPDLVATVGVIAALPGAANIVPGVVTCSLDVRHPQDVIRQAEVQHLLAQAYNVCQRRGLTETERQTSAVDSVGMDGEMAGALTQAAANAGVKAHPMHSGAGHDAMIVGAVVPSAMLFLRTPGGLSHHPEEAVLRDDVEAALAVVAGFLDGVGAKQAE